MAEGTKITDLSPGGLVSTVDDIPVARSGGNVRVQVGTAAAADIGTADAEISTNLQQLTPSQYKRETYAFTSAGASSDQLIKLFDIGSVATQTLAGRIVGMIEGAGPAVLSINLQCSKADGPFARLSRIVHAYTEWFLATEYEWVSFDHGGTTWIGLSISFASEYPTHWIFEGEYSGSLDIEALDFASVTNLNPYFQDDYGLYSIDFSGIQVDDGIVFNIDGFGYGELLKDYEDNQITLYTYAESFEDPNDPVLPEIVCNSWILDKYVTSDSFSRTFGPTASALVVSGNVSLTLFPDKMIIILDQNFTMVISQGPELATQDGNYSMPATGYYREWTLYIVQDATGGRSITWPTEFDWGGAGAPTLDTTANTQSIVKFCTRDGGVTYQAWLEGTGYAA